jgi:hypothetical protein
MSKPRIFEIYRAKVSRGKPLKTRYEWCWRMLDARNGRVIGGGTEYNVNRHHMLSNLRRVARTVVPLRIPYGVKRYRWLEDGNGNIMKVLS